MLRINPSFSREAYFCRDSRQSPNTGTHRPLGFDVNVGIGKWDYNELGTNLGLSETVVGGKWNFFR